ILASPVYVANYGATLKRWVDRAFVYVHRPVLAGKPVLAVCTTGGAYLATVCRQLLNVGEMMGMRRAGAVARSSMSLAKPVKPGELRRFVRAVHRGPLGQSPTLTQVVTFFGAKLVSSFSPVDQAFWRERNWDRMLYVHEQTLGWKRPIAWLLDRLLLPLVRKAF
ncbi:MAG: NAD(P)H-dependent oxidoreductase, partial [Chloroflexi bacterium]|nr:NAD(P)H-dependent oxidoreductase [Chloroflexota bacterium]